jgi:hypothetical protein
VTDSNRDFILNISRELGRNELLLSIVNEFEGGLTISNAIDRFRLTKAVNSDCDEALEFIASHFNEFDSSDLLRDLSIDELESILSHSSLKLVSEDDLCAFVLSGLDQELSSFGLFEYVRFEYVSVGVLERFCDLVGDHLEHLNVSIWSRIRTRLLNPISIDPVKSRYRSVRLSPVEGAPLHGIISYLSRRCQGNVHEKGIVTVTGHDCHSDNSSYAASNAADLMVSSYFYSKNEPNQSLTYDFGDRRVNLSHYSLRSQYNAGENGYYLQSWVIEGSVDGANWTEVDRHEEDRSLNYRNPVQCFSVQNGGTDFRFVRLQQTGPNQYYSPNHCLVISGFELFGGLTE